MGNMDWEDFVGDPDYATHDPDEILESSLIPTTGKTRDPE